MNKIEIYEPAMCCSTGVCGPSIDPEMMRVAVAIDTIAKAGIAIGRFTLSGEPQAFIANAIVNAEIMKEGVNTLPLTLVDGIIVKRNEYPTNAELTEWAGVPLDKAKAFRPVNSGCCGGNTGCC